MSLPQKKQGRFINPHAAHIRRSFKDFILWKTGYYKDLGHHSAPESFVFPYQLPQCNLNHPWASWINHSSFFISINGYHFLTDPIWSKRCSPFSFLGPKRRHAPGMRLSELPKVDFVLISHDHYDHLDEPTVMKLKYLFPKITWVVPYGVKKWFIKRGITQVVELQWWQEFKVTPALKITAVPTQHFSGRSTRDLNQTLWAGYVVEESSVAKCFYFVGDTGYNPYDFKKIGETFPSIDLSLIPIGSYMPRSFMSPVHIEPKHSVAIHQEVKSRLSIAMHWKTFHLSDEAMHQPPYDLYLALKQAKIDPSSFLALDPGVKINW